MSRYFIRAGDAPPYHPANHTGTTNRRLVGEENVGARNVEVVYAGLGTAWVDDLEIFPWQLAVRP